MEVKIKPNGVARLGYNSGSAKLECIPLSAPPDKLVVSLLDGSIRVPEQPSDYDKQILFHIDKETVSRTGNEWYAEYKQQG